VSTEWPVLVIGEHHHPTRLVASVRHGAVVDHVPLNARRPHYEDARAECEQRWPDRRVFVLALGEGEPAAGSPAGGEKGEVVTDWNTPREALEDLAAETKQEAEASRAFEKARDAMSQGIIDSLAQQDRDARAARGKDGG
jgi:hypothetical protein